MSDNKKLQGKQLGDKIEKIYRNIKTIKRKQAQLTDKLGDIENKLKHRATNKEVSNLKQTVTDLKQDVNNNHNELQKRVTRNYNNITDLHNMHTKKDDQGLDSDNTLKHETYYTNIRDKK